LNSDYIQKINLFKIPFIMKNLLIIHCFLLITVSIVAQAEPSDTVVDFSKENLEKHVYKLASKEFEGRQAGTAGGRKAAEYIASKFSEYGLKKPEKQESYYQPFDFMRRGALDVGVTSGNFKFRQQQDFYVKNAFTIDKVRTRFVFLRYGINRADYSDFEGVNLKGKIAVMLVGKPDVEELGRNEAEFSSNAKIRLAKSKGAKGVIFVHTSDKAFQKGIQINKIRMPKKGVLEEKVNDFEGYPVFYFNRKAGEHFMRRQIEDEIKISVKLFKAKKRKKAYSSTVIIFSKKTYNHSQNVIGIVEGELKNDYIVISAHYDHLGKKFRFIYNGADDNASGVSGLLELARVFSEYAKKGIRPKRSIVFIAFSAEEEGMLGSEYFTKYPTIPLKRTVLNINMDMIGRAKQRKNKSVFYLITSSEEVVDFHNKALKNYNKSKFKFNYSLNDRNHPKQVFYRSDHYNFYKEEIPFIFYHTNDHADYHQPTDVAQKIRFDALLNITELIFHVTKYSAEHLEVEHE
jgi:hypothetical protein